jgi:ABC transport system ATP-binding/permease protein
MKLIIEDDEGRKTVVPLVREEITIGRQDGNTIKLTERNVSRRHARLVRDNGFLVIEDLGSYNGVRVNGDRIVGPRRVKEGDLIEIGDYDLGIQGKIEPVAMPPQAAAQKSATRIAVPPGPAKDAAPAADEGPAATPSPAAGGATAIIRVSDLLKSAQVEARDLADAEAPHLIGLTGTIRGKQFPLRRTEVKVGRGEDNDIAIEHASLSRHHARLVLEDSAWKVVDERSANGIRINGEQYAMSAVRPGDVLELGHLKFRFCGPGETYAPEREDVPEDTSPTLRAPEALAQRARKGRGPLWGIALGLAVALAAGAVYFLKARRALDDEGGEMSAEAAVKAGDLLYRRKDFLKALEFYEQARSKGESPPNFNRASEEARAQQIDQDLERAIAVGDFDKAKAFLERCADETTFYCRKSREKADQVRQGFAKAHLAKARAAKGARPEICQQEVQQVLAADPANAEARQLTGQCAPVQVAAAAPAKEPARRPAGPSAKDRDEKARQLLGAANALTQAKEYPAAMAKYQAVLDLKPSGPIAGMAYRGLGTAAAHGGDAKGAAKWFKRYLPYVDDPALREQVETLIQQYSGE